MSICSGDPELIEHCDEVEVTVGVVIESRVHQGEAAVTAEQPRLVLEGPHLSGLPASAIVTLHGGTSDPDHVVLTERDLTHLIRELPEQWASVIELLRERPLLAVGTSLRDPSIIALLEEVGPNLSGWIVMPQFDAADVTRLERWSLEPIKATADALFVELARQLQAQEA